MQRQVSSAQRIAEHLEAHPGVAWVSYPGLESSPHHALAQRYLPKGSGAILTFGIRGGLERARQFIEALHHLLLPGQRG